MWERVGESGRCEVESYIDREWISENELVEEWVGM